MKRANYHIYRYYDIALAKPLPRKRFAFLAVALVALSVLSAMTLSSCAAPLRVERSVDPLTILARDALVYARLDGEAARVLVPDLLPVEQRKALSPLLDRTTSLALALGSSKPAAPGGVAPANGSTPELEAVFLGDYPFRTASLALGSQPGWKRDRGAKGTGGFFVNGATGIKAAVPGPNVALATTRDFEALLERAKNPGASPLPPRLDLLASKELAVFAPNPFRGLAAAFGAESPNVPASGLLLSAEREPRAKGDSAEASYLTTVAFAMPDAATARVYRPALRLAWFLIARGLLSEDADSALAADFKLDGEVYWASGIRLRASTLAAALSRLRATSP